MVNYSQSRQTQNTIQSVNQIYYMLKKDVLMFGLYFNISNKKLRNIIQIKNFQNMLLNQTTSFIKILNEQQNTNELKNTLFNIYTHNNLNKNFTNKNLEIKNITMDDLYISSKYIEKDYQINIFNDYKDFSKYLVNIDFIVIYIIFRINNIAEILNCNKNFHLNINKSNQIVLSLNKLIYFLVFFLETSNQSLFVIFSYLSVQSEYFNNFVKHIVKSFFRFNSITFATLIKNIELIFMKTNPSIKITKDSMNYYISGLITTFLTIDKLKKITYYLFNNMLTNFKFLYFGNLKMFIECKNNQKIFQCVKCSIFNDMTKIKNNPIYSTNVLQNFKNMVETIEKQNQYINIKNGIFYLSNNIVVLFQKIKKFNCHTQINIINCIHLNVLKNINYKTINLNQFKKLKRKYENIRNIKDYNDVIIDQTTKKNKIE